MRRAVLRRGLSEGAVHGAGGSVLVRQVVGVRVVRVVRQVTRRQRRRAVAGAQVRRGAVVLLQRQRRARRPPVPPLLHLNGRGGASRRAAARAPPRARQRVRVRVRRVPAPRLTLAPRHFETRSALAAPALAHPRIRSLHPTTLHLALRTITQGGFMQSAFTMLARTRLHHFL